MVVVLVVVVVVLGWLEESWELFDAKSSEHLVLLRAVRHGGGVGG